MSDLTVIAGDILGVAGLVLAPTGLVALLLSRRQANKKLQLEGDSVEASQWTILQKSYSDLLQNAKDDRKRAEDRATDAENATKAALKELEEHKTAREAIIELFNENSSKLAKIRDLFMSVLKRNNLTMTADEQEIFDSTVPAARIRRDRKATQ